MLLAAADSYKDLTVRKLDLVFGGMLLLKANKLPAL
jgi:hypothetical protein